MISVTKTNNHNITNSKDLSILVSMYGLSFMIYNQDTNEKKFFEYTFEAYNPSILQKKLQEILDERTILQDAFKSIRFIHHNQLNTLVPESYFDPENFAVLLQQQVKLLPNDQINYDEIKALHLYNIYVPYKNIAKSFTENTQNIVHKHSASEFLTAIMEEKKQAKNLPVFEIYLNIFPNDFQIAVFKNEKLQLYNAFSFQNIDEFLYYLFFIVETLEIKETRAQFYIMGLDSTHKIVQNIKEFTQNIQVLKPKSPSQINNYL